MKLSNARIGPTPSSIWRHVIPRISPSDFVGAALLIALVLVAAYSVSDCGMSEDQGLQLHAGGHLFRIRYVRAH